MAGLPALRGLRTARGLSQNALYAELYKLHGVDAPSRQTIANYESGATSPRITEAEILADFFGVSLDELAGRDSPAAASSPAAGEAPPKAPPTGTVVPPRPLPARPHKARKTPRAG
jgi:transcriptional regulator with XRE-family HTH domain